MLPIDQVMIGRVLEARGAARVVSKKASADRIRATVQELLRLPSYRAAAEPLGAAIRERDGAVEAADRLETLLPVTVR
jgi:UDP:flavonoid glycosyltransferase YjiC (YdhE family)